MHKHEVYEVQFFALQELSPRVPANKLCTMQVRAESSLQAELKVAHIFDVAPNGAYMRIVKTREVKTLAAA